MKIDFEYFSRRKPKWWEDPEKVTYSSTRPPLNIVEDSSEEDDLPLIPRLEASSSVIPSKRVHQEAMEDNSDDEVLAMAKTPRSTSQGYVIEISDDEPEVHNTTKVHDTTKVYNTTKVSNTLSPSTNENYVIEISDDDSEVHNTTRSTFPPSTKSHVLVHQPATPRSSVSSTKLDSASTRVSASSISNGNLEAPTAGSHVRLGQLSSHLGDSEIIDQTHSSDLKAILAITRRSFRTWDKEKIIRMEGRCKELVHFVLGVHRQQHPLDCVCSPTKHNFFLNGVSSNNAGHPQAREAFVLEPVSATLRRFLDDSSDGGQITIIVSTSDGFLTNVDGFAAFFEPFKALNLWYLVHENGTSYRHMTVSSIMKAIEDVRAGHTESSTAQGLVLEFAGLATGKLLQATGKSMVRYITQQRNMTNIDNVTDRDAMQNSISSRDATIEVVRYYSIAGTESQPQFERVKEARMPPKIVNSKLLCPVPDCPETTATFDEMIVHLIENHICEGVCPLCLPPFNKLGYDLVIDCIYHMQRHLAVARQNADSRVKVECPYCFKLLGDSTNMTYHIESHLQHRNVLDFANSAGTVNTSERQWYESMQPAARRTAAIVQLSQMSTMLQNVTYEAPLIPSLATLNSSQQSKLSAPVPVSNGEARVYTHFLPPNTKRTDPKDAGFQLLKDGRIACPLPDCCDEIFDRTWDCASHVLRQLMAAKRVCPWCRPEKQSVFLDSAQAKHTNTGHIQKHLPPSLPCPKKGCPTLFRHRSNVSYHMKTKHSGKASD